MLVLGIETTCDETAAAVVDGCGRIRAQRLHAQSEHAGWGGVVPEVAARAHIRRLAPILRQTLAEARVTVAALDGVAAAAGPGLMGGLIVAVNAAKAMALAAGKPFLAINHLAAHALSPRLVAPCPFPYLALLVSGGHSQFLAVEQADRLTLLGETLDDAAGEAFDKAGRLLGLGYPGGARLEACARNGDDSRFALPRPLRGRRGCAMSFSGLKTALRMKVAALPRPVDASLRADLAASFQRAMADSLAERSAAALHIYALAHGAGGRFVAAGGVAANAVIREALRRVAERHGMSFFVPPPHLCTDNAAMIAWAGVEKLRLGLADGLAFVPRPRWPPHTGIAGGNFGKHRRLKDYSQRERP